MPFLFLMVLPTMMWDSLMLPSKPQQTKQSSPRESSRESSREPWGRLTP